MTVRAKSALKYLQPLLLYDIMKEKHSVVKRQTKDDQKYGKERF